MAEHPGRGNCLAEHFPPLVHRIAPIIDAERPRFGLIGKRYEQSLLHVLDQDASNASRT
jgi:hypothetical protein